MAKISTKTRTGVVFRPGNYPDKGIPVVTEADMDAIVAASLEPVEFDSEHGPSLFDGLLGKARNFRTGTDGGQKVVFADWDEPEPLAQLLGDTPRTVSPAFDDWNTRKITKIALAKFPRISDAQFSQAVAGAYAAFSAGQRIVPLAVNFAYYTTEERDVIPTEDFGDPDNKLFPARTQDEANESMRQLIHAADPTKVKANLLAICERKKFKMDSWPYARPGVSVDLPAPRSYSDDYYFSATPFENSKGAHYNNPDSQEQNLQMNSNNPTGAGGATPPAKKEPGMLEKMAAFFGWSPEQTASMEATFNTATPREIELQAEVNRLKAIHTPTSATNFSTKAGRDAQAATAAQKLLDGKRILPHQLPSVTADFSRALEDDASNPAKVTFSVTDAQNQARDVEASRFDSLQSLYSALPEHDLETEKVREMPAESIALFSREATQRAATTAKEDFDADAYRQMTGQEPPKV